MSVVVNGSEIKIKVDSIVNIAVKEQGITFPTVNKPWVKRGDTNATNATAISKTDSIYHNGFVAIGATSNLETQNNDAAVIKSVDEGIGLRLKTDANATEFNPLVFDYSNLNDDSFPNFEFRANRFDGINGIDPLPNLVTRLGFNAGSATPPAGQVKLETAFEYYYNLQNADEEAEPEIVSEWHVEFTPLASSGKPIQRWISWAGRHDGTYTSVQITGNLFNLVRSDNSQMIKVEDQGTSSKIRLSFFGGAQINGQSGDIQIENALNISGTGYIFNANNEYIRIGKSGNANALVLQGRTNGDLLELNSSINTNRYDHYFWAGGYGIRNLTTARTPIAIHNSAADSTIALVNNTLQLNANLWLNVTYPTSGSGVNNGSVFKGTDGALYYKGGSGTVTLIANP